MHTINRQQLQEMMQNGVPVVEVLSTEQYEEYHLPQAINVPLGESFEGQIQRAVPNKQEAVVVYCYDHDCQASSKAAKRMEDIGYTEVYDYEAGKADWKSAGLPVEASASATS